MVSSSSKLFLALNAWTTSTAWWFATAQEALDYGVDVSFPMHYADILPADKNPLGDRQAFYNDFLNGCVEHFGNKGNRCVQTEADRIEMSLRQPQSMQVCVWRVAWWVVVVGFAVRHTERKRGLDICNAAYFHVFFE